MGKSHSVKRLPIHLEQPDEYVFENGLDVIPEREEEHLRSMLEAFFILNTERPELQVLYMDVVKDFIYVPKERRWKDRQRGGDKVVSRMRDVNPFFKELFSMRMLLLHVKSPKCFDDLKFFNDVQYKTFSEAAQARNLILGEESFFSSFDDYMAFRNPKQLRYLLAHMLITKTISKGDLYWKKYGKEMYGDFLLKPMYANASEEQLLDLALHDLNRIFSENNTTCETYGLPRPKNTPPAFEPEEPIIIQSKLALFNEGQTFAYEIIRTAIFEQSPFKTILLIGPGGSGKTTVYKEICYVCRQSDPPKIALCFATTGIAATLMPNGETVHRGFGIPFEVNSDAASYVRKGSRQGDLLKTCHVILIDEGITKMFSIINYSLNFFFNIFSFHDVNQYFTNHRRNPSLCDRNKRTVRWKSHCVWRRFSSIIAGCSIRNKNPNHRRLRHIKQIMGSIPKNNSQRKHARTR